MSSTAKNKRVFKYLYSPPGAYTCPDRKELSDLAKKWEPEFRSFTDSIKPTSPIYDLSTTDLSILFKSVVMLMIPYLIEHNTLKKYEGISYSNYNEIALGAFKLLESRGEFIKKAKKEKDNILLVPECRVAIEILKYLSTAPVLSVASQKSAKEILKTSGLGIFIPIQPKNITKNSALQFFKERPLLIIGELKYMKELITKYVDRNSELRSADNKKKISKAFRDYFGVDPTEFETIKEKFEDEKVYLQISSVAIVFLCFKFTVSYNSLHDLIYRKFPEVYKNHPEYIESIKN